MLVYPRVQCEGSASASDRAVRLALLAQCVAKAVRKAVLPPKRTANQEAERGTEHAMVRKRKRKQLRFGSVKSSLLFLEAKLTIKTTARDLERPCSAVRSLQTAAPPPNSPLPKRIFAPDMSWAPLFARAARGLECLGLAHGSFRRLHQHNPSLPIRRVVPSGKAGWPDPHLRRSARGVTMTSSTSGSSPSSSLWGERVSAEAVAGAVDELRLGGLQVVAAADEDPDAAREVALKSRDFFWYSPILKETLRGRRGDAVVVARDEADVIAVAGCAARRGVPLVARGAGTGNYGQAVPLRGGIVLDLSKLSGVVHFDATEGVVRAGAGANLGELEDLVRVSGWELRQHPSTRRTATLGGFIAGGSTGVGALLHGGLAEDGAIMARLGLSHGWPGAGNTDTRNQTRNYRRPLDPKRSKPSRETVRGKRVCCADPIHLFTVTQCRVSLLPPTRARPVSVRVRSRSLSLRRDRVAPPPTGAARGHRGASAPGPGADRARCVPRGARVRHQRDHHAGGDSPGARPAVVRE